MAEDPQIFMEIFATKKLCESKIGAIKAKDIGELSISTAGAEQSAPHTLANAQISSPNNDVDLPTVSEQLGGSATNSIVQALRTGDIEDTIRNLSPVVAAQISAQITDASGVPKLNPDGSIPTETLAALAQLLDITTVDGSQASGNPLNPKMLKLLIEKLGNLKIDTKTKAVPQADGGVVMISTVVAGPFLVDEGEMGPAAGILEKVMDEAQRMASRNLTETQAAEGDAQSQYLLGYLCMTGQAPCACCSPACNDKLAVTKDTSKGEALWQKAAKQGNINAQYSLGKAYLLGHYGIKLKPKRGAR
jgi:hypothetical protein